jgi:hypothetical protein
MSQVREEAARAPISCISFLTEKRYADKSSTQMAIKAV